MIKKITIILIVSFMFHFVLAAYAEAEQKIEVPQQMGREKNVILVKEICENGYAYIIVVSNGIVGGGDGISTSVEQIFETSKARHLPPQPKTCK